MITNAIQFAYGVIAMAGMVTNDLTFDTSTSYPYFTPRAQVELWEGITERIAAADTRHITERTVTDPFSYLGHFEARNTNGYIDYPDYTNTVQGSFRFFSYMPWRGSPLVLGNFQSLLGDNTTSYYPIVTWATSHRTYMAAHRIMRNWEPFYVASYTTNSVTRRTFSLPYNPIRPYPLPGQMTVSNLCLMHEAVTNMSMTTTNFLVAKREEWLDYYRGTVTWYVAELATGVTCYADASVVCVVVNTNAGTHVTNDISFVSDPVSHYGPSTNRVAVAEYVTPDAPHTWYRLQPLRPAVIKWHFSRCP